jgi:hypothetical protein
MQIHQAGVGLVRGYRGDARISGQGNRQRLVTARLQHERERLAKNAITVTKD